MEELATQKAEAASHLSAALAAGWTGYAIGGAYSLDRVAAAHNAVEDRSTRGRVVLNLMDQTL